MKMKNESHRYNINWPGPKQGHKHTKCKVSPYDLMMILICNKIQVSNIWSSIHEKLSNTDAEWKKTLLIKKVCRYRNTRSKQNSAFLWIFLFSICTSKRNLMGLGMDATLFNYLRLSGLGEAPRQSTTFRFWSIITSS